MRAAVLRAPWEMGVEELRDPEPRSGEVLVRVAACGVCHSDLHLVKGETPARLPRVPGHEISGTVVALGEGVEGPAVGSPVVAPFILPCGDCPACAAGRDDFCERFWALNRRQGVLYDGTTRLETTAGEPLWMDAMSGFAELAVVPATSVFPAPDGVPLVDAATLGCAVFTAYGALRNAAELQAGESVAVIGAGGVGSNVVQVARAMGAERVIAVDIGEEKLDAARRLGATDTIDASTEDVPARAAELTAGQGVDVAVEALGRPQTLDQAVRVVGLGGRVVAIGVSEPGAALSLEINDFVRRQIRVVGTYGARTRRDMPDLLELVAAGTVRPAVNVTRHVSLDETLETLRDLDRGEIVGRAVVTFDSGG